MKNSTKPDSQQKLQRRSFLKGVVVTGAAASSGVLTAESMAESTTDSPPLTDQKGYRETDHIREYYKTARF